MKSLLRHLRAIDKQSKRKTPTSKQLLFCGNAPREQQQSAGGKAFAHQTYSFVVRTSLFTLSQLTLQTGLFLTGVMTAPAQTSVPDLTITKSHAGSFSIGGIGVYTLTVTNSGAASSSGVITVTDTLPSALSVNNGAAGPIVISGTNSTDWFCTSDASTPQKVTCTSASIISSTAGSNTSSFNLSVQIKSTAPVGTNSITNTATVSGGGETNTTNNTANDPTSISAAPTLTCPTIYGGARNSTGAYNQIRIYSSTGVPGVVVHTMPTSETRAVGITPLLDSNGRRRIYYVTLPPDNRLRYFDGVNNVDTGITIPTANTVVRLAVDSSGIVHIMDGSPNLWRYNPTTNTLSSSITIADDPGNIETLSSSSGGDIAFDAAGVMYVVAFDTPTTTKFRLFRVDGLAAGSPVATLLATNPTTLQTGAIAYDPSGQLLMMTGGATASVFSWNLTSGTISTLPSASPGVFDLASCNFPNFLPVLNATKTAAKISGSVGSDVAPGDTIEYTIVVRNTGSIIAAGVKFADSIPTGTTYVPNSTTLNGTSVADITGAMRYTTPNLINSPGRVAGSLTVDTTPATTTDNEAVIKFRVKVNTTSPPSSVSNQGTVFYTGGPTAGIKTDDPTASGSLDSTITPINQFPDTTAVSAPSQANPGGTATVQVPNLSGTDPEEGPLGTAGSFKIVTLPSNGTLYYNGTSITSPNFVITNYDPSKLTLDPNDGAITVSFTYTAIDSTGREDPTPATVTMPFTVSSVALPPNILLVKRITAVNGNRIKNPNDNTPLNLTMDDAVLGAANNTPSDTAPNWPLPTSGTPAISTFLTGAVDAGQLNPGDTIEYTIYFLNAGGSEAKSVKICDRIQGNQSFLPAAYGASNDLQLQIGNGSIAGLTQLDDTVDRGAWFPSDTPPSNCNLQPLPVGMTDNGAIAVQITGTGHLGQPDLAGVASTTAPGTPDSSYGFIRFTTKVK